MAKFCPDCANPIRDGNMPFCPKCGAKLPITSPEVHPPATQPIAVQQLAHPSSSLPSVTLASTSVQPPAKQPQGSTTESNTKKGFVDDFLGAAEGIESFFGAYYQPKSVTETAKAHGYDLTTLSPAKTSFLQDLAKAEYDLHVVRGKYNLANSSLGPIVLGILGLILTIFIIGILILIVALIWYLIRVNSRMQFYQEIKDLETRCTEIEKKIETS
jgi:hypothetical protein